MNNNLLAALGMPLIVISAPAFSADYLSIEQAQSVIFPDAIAFSQQLFKLTESDKDQIKELSGKRQRWDEQKIWRVDGEQGQLGWFIVDDVVGKHEFITYALGITTAGKVVSIEILTYRETHGDEVREADWRQNFKGKTLESPFKLNNDIPNISGATLSARNITDGVKRLLALHQVVLSHE
jgi:Na+-translocating ferredoxin:NAD+ oxidoreductase RnfG subunit